MRRMLPLDTITRFFVTIILIGIYVSSNIIEVQADDRTSELLAALRENHIKIPDPIDYSKLVQKLESMQIDVPISYKENVTKYLDTGIASDLIKIETSKPGILTWYIHSLMFLRKDLIFAEYDDGEMYGGEILLKVIFFENQVTDMKVLWNSHKST